MIDEQLAIPNLLDLPVMEIHNPWPIVIIVLLLVVVGQLSDRIFK